MKSFSINIKTWGLGLFVALCGSHAAFAQVNLDKPVPVGWGDMVYQSSQDDKLAYALPLALKRLSAVSYSQKGDRMVAQFDVGVAPADFAELKTKVTSYKKEIEVRYFRAVKATIRPKSSTNIGEEFDSAVTALGDTSNFFGPTRYALSVLRLPRLFNRPKSTLLFSQLFGTSGADHIGTIDYEFNSIVGGQPYLSKTSIAIFVGSPAPAKTEPMNIMTALAAPAALVSLENVALPHPAVAPRILKDHDVACWDQVEPGVICLRQP